MFTAVLVDCDTVTVALELNPPSEAVTPAVPVPTAMAKPEFTVTTLLFVEVQVALEVTLPDVPFW